MLAPERLSLIVDALQRAGTVTVTQLSQKLGVSEVTVRKDLIRLEHDGLLTRIHGGATLLPVSPTERSFTEKLHQSISEKSAISDAALAYVNPGDTLILGAGTTTMELAKRLRLVQGLTVVTNAVNVAMELNSHGSHNVILVGGEMRHKSYALIGPMAEQGLRELYVSKCFLGTDGIDPQLGLTTLNVGEAHMNRVMMERSQKVYILADASKFGKTYLAQFADLADVDRILTDRMEEALGQQYADHGVIVEVVAAVAGLVTRSS